MPVGGGFRGQNWQKRHERRGVAAGPVCTMGRFTVQGMAAAWGIGPCREPGRDRAYQEVGDNCTPPAPPPWLPGCTESTRKVLWLV